jgi:hypothetical protein
MMPLKIKTLVRQWQDARLNCAPKREARLGEEIMERVNEELEEIKQTPRQPNFEWKFEELYEALKPMAHYWLRLRLMEKAGILPAGAKIGGLASQIPVTLP